MTIPQPAALLPDSVSRRRTMVDCQIRTFDVTDSQVLARLLEVPREIFLPDEWKELAYSDNALDIGPAGSRHASHRLLAPLVLAKMLQEATLKPNDKALDICSATGYSTALLAGLVGRLTSLNSDAAWSDRTAANLHLCDIENVDVVTGPLTQGWSPNAPYDVILINGAVEAGLENLFAQLSEGGRLIAIQQVSDAFGGRASKAVRYEKNAGKVSSRFLFDASALLLREFEKSPQFVF